MLLADTMAVVMEILYSWLELHLFVDNCKMFQKMFCKFIHAHTLCVTTIE